MADPTFQSAPISKTPAATAQASAASEPFPHIAGLTSPHTAHTGSPTSGAVAGSILEAEPLAPKSQAAYGGAVYIANNAPADKALFLALGDYPGPSKDRNARIPFEGQPPTVDAFLQRAGRPAEEIAALKAKFDLHFLRGNEVHLTVGSMERAFRPYESTDFILAGTPKKAT